MVVAVVVLVLLLVGLPALAVVVGPRVRPPKPRPRLGTDDRAFQLARDHTSPASVERPAGLTPAECGVLAVPTAHYQHATATLLDLARRGHVRIALHTAPTETADVAWWTLTATAGTDELRRYEQVLLDEVGLRTGPVEFPNLRNGSVDRFEKLLVRTARSHRAATDAALALQHGVVREPALVDAESFAHAVALDVSPTLARSLAARQVAVPSWITTVCATSPTWALLDRFALEGSPLLPQGPFQAGFSGGTPLT